jgi:hypothetical protein
MPKSGPWQNSGSVLNKFGFTTNQQKSCFSMTVQSSTQVQSLGKPLKKLCWTVAPHLPYSHLLAALQDAIHGMKFETDDDASCAVRSWLLHEQDKAMYRHGTHTCSSFVRGRMKWTETLWKNAVQIQTIILHNVWFSLLGNKYLPRKKISGITFWTYLTYLSSCSSDFVLSFHCQLPPLLKCE